MTMIDVNLVAARDEARDIRLLELASPCGGVLPPAEPVDPFAPGPFAFANPHRVANVLKTAGFTQVNLEPHEAQLTMGEATTVDEAVDFTLEIGPISRLLAEANPDIRSRVREDLRTVFAPYAKQNEIRLGGAVWIVTARKA